MTIIHRCFAAFVILLTLAGALRAAEDVGDVGYAADSNQNGWTWICRHSAPIDGVIHSITARVGSTAGSPQVVFKQFRNTSGNTFQLIDQSPTYTLETGTVNYPVNFTTVLVGDYIGYYVSSTSDAYHYISGAGEYCYSYSGNHTTGSQTYTTRTNWMVPMLATIFEDDSGEMFGDATLSTNAYQGYTFVDEHDVPRDGTIAAIATNLTTRAGSGQAYVSFKHFRNVSGTQYTVIQESESFYATVGLATYPVNFTGVLENDRIGYYIWGPVNSYRSSATGHTCYSVSGNQHSGTTTYTTRSGWMSPVAGIVYASGAVEVFGSAAVNCGSRLNNATFVAPYTAPRDGHVVAMGLDIKSVSTSPTLVFKHFRNTSGNNFQLIAQSQTFTPQTGMTIYDVDFPNVQENDYFGYYTNNADNYRSWGGETCWSVGGNHTSGTTTYTVRNGWRAPLAVFLANDTAGTAVLALDGGYVSIPQGTTVGSTATKTGGPDFVTGLTLLVDGGASLGLSGSITVINNINSIDIDWTADRDADAGTHYFAAKLDGLVVATGSVEVAYPQQLVSARQSTAQEPPLNGTMVANGVYAHNGEFRHDLQILSIPGRMLPLCVGLTYRSQLDTIGPVGAGWSASFDNRLTYSSGADEITLYSGNGRIDVFDLQSGGTAGTGPYVLPGFFLQIWRDEGTKDGEGDDVYTIKYAHGSVATYEAVNQDTANQQVFRQTEFADRYGNAITFEYSSSGQLERMLGDMYDSDTSTTRYALDFTYNNHGRLYKITDYADYTGQQSVVGSSYTGVREWEFVYNTDAQLTEIKLPKTERYYSDTKGTTYRTRVQFTYDSSDNLLEVIDARQANETTPLGWLQNHYDSNRVDYQDVGRSSTSDTTHRQYVVYTDAPDILGRDWIYVIDAESHMSAYRVQVSGSAGGPFGTASLVRHHTGTWDTDATVISSTPAHTGDPSYFETTYSYDSEFQVIEEIHPLGNKTQWCYDIGASDQRSRGNLLRVLTHKGSISTTYLPTEQEYGLLTKFSYTSATQFNLLANSIGPRGFELGSSYNIVTDSGIVSGSGQADAFTTTYTYYSSSLSGPDGSLEKVTTPTVDTTYSPGTLNSGQYLETIYTYNLYGQALTTEDRLGVETSYAYGSSDFNQGYLTSVSAGSQTMSPLTTSFTYNSVGCCITTTDPESNTYTTYFNQLNQAVKSTMPQVSAQMPGESAATYYTEMDFDLNGNVEASRWSNIDEKGDTLSPSEPETTFTYNILDIVTGVTEPIDLYTTRTTSFTYDRVFRRTETTLPEGNRTGVDLDEIGRAFKTYAGYDNTNVTKTNALVKREVFFDANSNVVKAVDGRSNDSHYTYDAYNRLHKAEDRLSTSPNYSLFTYNEAGQIVETVRMGKKYILISTGPDTYGFDTGGLVAIAKNKRAYDNVGRTYKSEAWATNSGGSDLGYSGDETVPTGADDGWSTSTVKFLNNGLVDETYGDLLYATGYEYDSYNRLVKVYDDRDGGGPGTGGGDNYNEYTYDDNGNVLTVTAHLYDDRGSSGNKTLTTTFEYDEINRLTSDTSPDLSGPSTGLTREYKYNARSLVVRTYDRKDVERITDYDLLSRPTHRRVSSVTRRVIGTGGTVSTSTSDIVSRTVYNKNSEVTQSIDQLGNRTYLRYDIADRWLQTQHPDGGSGTPLKTTAGTTHSISAVGSTVFYSGTSSRDGNGNLLNLIDENNTTVAWTYDANDNVLTESGTPYSGNPWEIEGETGLSYTYDGLYRAVYGETHDASDTFTETDSVFNTLGTIERQRQIVHLAHPDDPDESFESTVLSDVDESRRRWRRTNPSGITRVSWEFDRKNRPVTEHNEFWISSTWNDSIAAEYQYVGGGLLHSRQTRHVYQYHPGKTGGAGVVDFAFVSDYERDNLLRVTKARHVRDDLGIGKGQRLIARYEYGFDENSLMKWEARWFHDDSSGTSDTPTQTDFYGFNKCNVVEKGIYNATKYGSSDTDITTSNLASAFAEFMDDTSNEGTFSDRVYYARRKTGTRDKVNWYRGAPSPSSTGFGAHNDASAGPEQTTDYTTGENSSGDPEYPESDGTGSRHNYEVIGQVALDYDNRRNLTADATREFRYSYNSQLRRVWRKSDGNSDTTGLLATYAEDAFGRRVLARSYWELGRQILFDTRFALDVDMDADNDSVTGGISYVDGGITSSTDASAGQLDQIASWPSLLDKTAVSDEEQYIDFYVKVPDVSGYLGFIGYEGRELRIYGDRYEVWNTGGGSAIDTYYAPGGSTAGFHNIGLRGGSSAGIWIDGTDASMPGITNTTGGTVYFGTHNLGTPLAPVNGIKLLENLTYLRSFNRTSEDQEPLGGGTPRVTIAAFDGPQPVTVTEIWPDLGSGVQPVVCLDVTDETMNSRFDDSGNRSIEISLPNGRRATGPVIRERSDLFVDDGEGPYLLTGEDEELPGVYALFVGDATGANVCYGRNNPATAPVTDGFSNGSGLQPTGEFDRYGTVIRFGNTRAPSEVVPTAPDAEPEPDPTYEGEPMDEAVGESEQTPASTGGDCACQGDAPNAANNTSSKSDTTTGQENDSNGTTPVTKSPPLGLQTQAAGLTASNVKQQGSTAPVSGGDVKVHTADLSDGLKFIQFSYTKPNAGCAQAKWVQMVKGTLYYKYHESNVDTGTESDSGWEGVNNSSGTKGGTGNGGGGFAMDGETWFVDANSGAKKTAAQGGDPYESGYVESGGGGTKGADGTKGIAVAEDAPGVDAAHLAAAKKSFDAIAAQEQKHWDDTKQPQSVRDSIRTVTDIRVHLDFSTYLELCGTYVYRVDWSQDTDYNVKSKTFTHSISVKAQTSMSDLVLDRDNNGNPGPKDVARTTFQKNGPQ